jgi:hypothetical protein
MALVLTPHEHRKDDLNSHMIRSAASAKMVTESSTASDTQLARCGPEARGDVGFVAIGNVLIDPLGAAVAHRSGIPRSLLLLGFCQLTGTDCQECRTVFFPPAYDTPATSSALRDRERIGIIEQGAGLHPPREAGSRG